jgi:hypothetical protein
LLERWAEPFDTLAARLEGGPDQRQFLDEAWKFLILNHPHDSICGCSVDPVHRQMMARFEQAAEIGRVVLGSALHRIAARIDSSKLSSEELLLTVFNPCNWSVTDTLVLDVEIDEDWLAARGVAISHDNVYRTFRDIELRDSDGNRVPHTILQITPALVHKPWIEHFVPNRSVLRLKLAMAVKSIPGVGYSSFTLSLPAKPRRLDHRMSLAEPMELDNGIIWCSINPDGTLSMGRHDDPRQATLTGLHWFEDGGDNGDSYAYSPPRRDRVVTSFPAPVELEVLHHSPSFKAIALEWELEIPESLAADRQHRCPNTRTHRVRSVFSLGWGMHRLDVETTFVNASKDHRLQVCFETRGMGEDGPNATDSRSRIHTAAMPFHLVERPNTVNQPSPEQWIEDEPLERPMHGWVRCGDLALIADGLPEYEIVAQDAGSTVLKLTLLRAVEYLAAATHGNTILFGAGPHMATPDQQELGRHCVFRYALCPLPPASSDRLNWIAATQAMQHQAQWQTVTLPSQAGIDPAAAALGTVPMPSGSRNTLPRAGELLHVSGQGLLLSSIKASDDANGDCLVRVWNTTQHQSHASLSGLTLHNAHATMARLDETPLATPRPGRAENGSVVFDCPSHRIVTVRLSASPPQA